MTLLYIPDNKRISIATNFTHTARIHFKLVLKHINDLRAEQVCKDEDKQADNR